MISNKKKHIESSQKLFLYLWYNFIHNILYENFDFQSDWLIY